MCYALFLDVGTDIDKQCEEVKVDVHDSDELTCSHVRGATVPNVRRLIAIRSLRQVPGSYWTGAWQGYIPDHLPQNHWQGVLSRSAFLRPGGATLKLSAFFSLSDDTDQPDM